VVICAVGDNRSHSGVSFCILSYLWNRLATIPNSQFPIPNSQFPIPNSQFPIPNSRKLCAISIYSSGTETMTTSARNTQEILIADAQIENLNVLLAGVAPSVETWLVTPEQDALGLIFKALALPQVTRLHLLAHGTPGEIRFGGQAVTAADFCQRFDGAAQRDLEISFWSCRTGAGAAGQAFVQAVAAATGARVAATSDLVGAADKGGNWDLGVTAPFSAEARAGFGGVLTAPVLNYSNTTFVEASINDGSITTTSILTLTGDTFVGAVGAALGAVTNVPTGLTAVLVKTTDTTATLSFTGSAIAHANAQDIANLTVTFTDAEFAGGSAAAVTNATKTDLGVEFSDSINHAPVITQPTTLAFADKVEIPGFDSPYSVASADVDGDGKADLIVGSGTTTLSVLKNISVGETISFAPKVDYATAAEFPNSVIATDLNGDGKADLIATNINDNTGKQVSVLQNNGDGTFANHVDYATGYNSFPYPTSVTSADIDGDGKADLIVANYMNNGVSVLKNTSTQNGAISFANKVNFSAGANPNSVTSADVDGDGKADLIVANLNADTVSVLKNTSANGTIGFASPVPYATGDRPYSVTSADIDGDGKADLIVANDGSDTVSVLKNNGDGTFAAKVDYATGDTPVSVTAADVDGDGRVDLVVGNGRSDTVSVLKNNGNGTFAAKVDYAVSVNYVDRAVIAADIDGNGMADLVVANASGHPVSILRNTGGPTATTLTQQVWGTGGDVSPQLTLRDPDGDADWTGGTLKVQITANADGSDGLGLANFNTLGIWLVDGTHALMNNETQIGTADSFAALAGNALTFTFNANATNDLVQAVARAIGFSNGSNNPGTAARIVTFTATDKNGAETSITQTITITADTTAPTLDTIAPTFQSAYISADGTTITLAYDEVLSATTAVAGAFAVWVNTTANAVTAVTVNGSTVALNLTTAVANGDTVIIQYIDPTTAIDDTYAIQDNTGNDAIGITTTVTNNVSAPNHAPVLNDTFSPILTTIAEDVASAANTGTKVSDLLPTGSITDADGTAVEAIAISAVDTSHGQWQYQIGTTGWQYLGNFGTGESNVGKALLLGADDAIRFVPHGNYNGTLAAAITFHAWDQSSGTAGTYLTISGNTGGSGSLSTATDTAAITVIPVNDAPTFFGLGGMVMTDFGSGFDWTQDQSHSVSVVDGKILVVGKSNDDFALVRYNADGSLDTSFGGGDGKVTVDIGVNDYAYGAKVQTDGSILVAGRSGSSGAYDFALTRFTAAGVLDNSFGTNGSVKTSDAGIFDNREYGDYSVAMQTDGTTLVAGSVGDDFALARYTAAGVLDTSFGGGDGFVTTNFSEGSWEAARAVVQTAAGILVAGHWFGDFALARYTNAGVLDTSFGGGDGFVTTHSASSGHAIAEQTDGKIVVAGQSWYNNAESRDLALVRYNANGSLDTSFGGGDGIVTTDLGWGPLSWDNYSVAMQGEKILVQVTVNNGGSMAFALARFDANGSLDTTFGGGDGKVMIDFGGMWAQDCSFAFDADGNILVNGTTMGDFVLARYTADGVLDTRFDGDTAPTFSKGGTAVVLDGNVQVFDPELMFLNYQESGGYYLGDYRDTTLTIARTNGADDTDNFGFATDGTAFSVADGNKLRHYIDGDFAIYSNLNGTLTINFTGTTPSYFVKEVLQHITYATTDSSVSSIDLTWTFSDGGNPAGIATGSSTVKIGADTTPPVFTSAVTSIDGTTIILTFDEVLSATTAVTGAFAVSGHTVSSVAVSGSTVILSLDTSVANGETVTLGYNDPTANNDANAIQDNAGNDAVTLTATTVINGYTPPTNSAPTGAITITGSAIQGQTLAVTNTLADADGLGGMTYVWMANGTATVTANTYKLTQADVGKTITVAANYIDSMGNSERVFSAATAAVANVNDLPTGAVTISGTATQGKTLTAANTLADVDGLGAISYQWLANGTAITGATTKTLVLTQAQVGKIISVAASYTDKLGAAEKVVSTATSAVAHITAVADKGTPNNDSTLKGSAGNDHIDGLAGNDSLTGLAGNDSLIGGTGNDTLNGGIGSDSMSGGDGSDTYYVDNVGDKVTETNAKASSGGTDLVYSSLKTYTLTTNVEKGTILGTAAATPTLTGNALNNVLTGNTGANTLLGNAGNDSLTGLAGNDSLNGGIGNDTLNGGVGSDSMSGGDGSDTYYVDNVGDKVTETNAKASSGGTDLVYSSLKTYTLTTNVENGTILGTAAATLTGNALNNVLTGNTGANTLLGNAGNDTLNGGAGNDTLNGGLGKDIFQFNTALTTTNVDKITDFNPIDDTIRLENAIFKALKTVGALKTDQFYASTTGTAHDASDVMLYNKTTGELLYDADGLGTIAAVKIAVLGIGLALTAADFVVS
jgi:uncharacterized delta-60 repeat protein/uncharacterized repeat protein (TIGR02059 family)